VTAARSYDIEPLVRLSDLDEYRAGLTERLAGRWDEEKWTGYRVRFGVYGQKQPGVQMVRIKIPGGILPLPWLTTLARFNREFCQGDVHITTRQDIQTYFVPLERTGEALAFLYGRGMTTREACGNTLRNMTACALSGHCPREHVDAGAVAERLARSWLRHPLVQHMPRKAKFAVSGCATDCAAVPIHDLGFIATERAGEKGFKVMAGGGLGSQPRPATTVLDFVAEEELPVVVEAFARLHQRYSDRVNRNAARIKYVVKRFGEEKFRALFEEEFARLKGLAQRAWEPLKWRQPTEATVERTPMGVVTQPDGRHAIVATPFLGNLSADQLDALVELLSAAGIKEVRTTRDQNLVIPDVPAGQLDGILARLAVLGIPVPASAAESADIVSCPGTTTCRIGITNSPGLAEAVRQDSETDPTAKGVSVRISGCQNSCGQHHIGDFGFHGVAKKIDGKPAPHYQIHIGGDGRLGAQDAMVGLSGPIVAAIHAPQALRLLRRAYAAQRGHGETVRQWAERIGKPGIESVLAPLAADAGSGQPFIDWGDTDVFKGAPTVRGECAAPFASDDVLADLADDALIRLDRQLAAGRWEQALQAAEEASAFAGRRLLHHNGEMTTDDDPAASIIERLHGVRHPKASAALDSLLAQRTASLSSGRAPAYREAVARFLDTARYIVGGDVADQDAAE
jgi:sulfite reductase (NADPH) hemoprotein beta-component